MSVDERTAPSSRVKSGYESLVNSRKFVEFTRHTANVLGLAIVLLLVVAALFAPVIAPYDPIEQQISERLEPPSADHPMGTDQLGRDIFSRVLFGLRLSLGLSVLIVASTLLVGTLLGVISGYAGGLVDEAIMRFVDLLYAFPGLLFTLIIAAVLGPGFLSIVIAFSATGWTGYARIVRGEVLSVREDEFVKAAQLMGASRTRIIGRHVFPNVISPIVVLATMNMATVILGTAGLSFLGLGAQPPTPELGIMLANSRSLLTTAWWVANFPGMVIMLNVLGFNLLGDGIRDILDPRDRTSQRSGL